MIVTFIKKRPLQKNKPTATVFSATVTKNAVITLL